ncbi:aminotransferase class V-fold PLP-dependent enzyme [Maribacter algarum]|uniref:Aminotransferase class V-fold PLP-dependent enzyme n=1 Tax=Maribacter algarum (ex Zhang et al. 2020) TaxID=2578118 RepID=A0A5S3PPA0_9FLAO|nr:aminotransferase class V-fold PLP-dependent enzyme [Maribacter algarum]TMM56284.1 aminotransferase class V-fold PLP-dependent enzyme [Maribacter algarum]
MENIRKQFPILGQYIYVNTPVLGPMYDDLLDWRQERDLDVLIHATEMPKKRGHLLEETRTTISEVFECKQENVALINNFSTGMNFLLEGLSESSKVLVLENDYASVNWPFERREFEMHYAVIDENVEDTIAEIIEKEQINVMAFAIVHWQNGIKIDLEFIKQLKSKYPDLLIIADGTQFMGTQEFNFENSGIDVLGTSGYKWMLGGYGNGFMLFSDFAEQRIVVKSIGDNTASVTIKQEGAIPFAKYFEPGHLSGHSFGSLQFSLNFFQEIGMSAITTQNQVLSEKAMSVFRDMSLLETKVTKRKSHSTIFNIKGDDALFQYLIDNGVMCAKRGNGIRFGFHFYNTIDEITQIAELIEKR